MKKPKKIYLSHTWTDPRLVVKASVIDGKGVFTTKEIREGETLMIWGGEVIDRKEFEKTYKNYRLQTVVQISETEYLGLPIDDTDVSIDEYLNHSCDPNAWLTDEVTVAARRPIRIGEEITLDSATWNDDEEEAFTDTGYCTCGTMLCRHVLSPHDWKREDLQERYAGHFSPYLARRIEAIRKK